MARPFGTFKYSSLDALETGIDNYFAYCDDNHKPYTMSGLALSLDVTTQTLCNYGKAGYVDQCYFDAVNRARQRVLSYAEDRLYDKDGIQGAKFYLTNNSARMGGLAYSDKQEISVRDNTPPPKNTTSNCTMRQKINVDRYSQSAKH